MRFTLGFFPTLRDAPSDAEISSHKLMIRAGFDANKIFVIYNSLDYELQKEYFENYQKNNTKREFAFFKNSKLKTILFLGRLTSVKTCKGKVDF